MDRHGQQYGDDTWLSEGEKEKLTAQMAERGMSHLQIISGIARIEASIKRDALIRRRKAKQDCYECPIRPECLKGALERREPRGTWGGWFEEELDKMRRQANRRERNKTRATTQQQGEAA